MNVGIIEYGGGNTASVLNALRRLNVAGFVSSDAAAFNQASHLILPGVGSAGPVMQRLKESGLSTLLQTTSKPVLGICLGMQLLFEYSEEDSTQGLAIIHGEVRRTPNSPKKTHVGWNIVSQIKGRLMREVEEDSEVYYVHSYSAPVVEQSTAVTIFGSSFSASVSYKNYHGVQFHPEKSGEIGSLILSNFLKSIYV